LIDEIVITISIDSYTKQSNGMDVTFKGQTPLQSGGFKVETIPKILRNLAESSFIKDLYSVRCPTCEGDGKLYYMETYHSFKCPTCKGTCRLPKPQEGE